MGYFWVLSKPAKPGKTKGKTAVNFRKINKSSKIPSDMFFHLRSTENTDFPLGRFSLRSARSFRDEMPFSATNEATDAVNTDPLTA